MSTPTVCAGDSPGGPVLEGMTTPASISPPVDRHARQRIKASKPETAWQAERFTKMRNHYATAGLCDRCAAQAGYGHQHGWYAVHQPCTDCLPIVATFPSAKGNLWRSSWSDNYRGDNQ